MTINDARCTWGFESRSAMPKATINKKNNQI
jgi:hypothetical protein